VGFLTLATTLTEPWTVTAVGGTNPVLDTVYPVRCFARSILSQTREPDLFLAQWSERDKDRAREIHFQDPAVLHWQEGQRRSKDPLIVPGHEPWDPLSLLFRLRAIRTATEGLECQVLFSLWPELYRVTYLGAEALEVEAGAFQARRYGVAVHPVHWWGEEMFPGPQQAYYELYLSADSRRMPLLLRRQLTFGKLEVQLQQFNDSRPSTPLLLTDASAAR
jgi:hypothetical protein